MQGSVSKPRLFFVGFEKAFFDVEEVDDLEIHESLIKIVRINYTSSFRYCFDGWDPFELIIKGFNSYHSGLEIHEVVRAWKNVSSAEILLTTTEEFPSNMVYPYCNVDERTQITDFVQTFHLSGPKKFDFDAVSSLLDPFVRDFKERLLEIYVGCLSYHAKPNSYYPKDGEDLGHSGIVITPTTKVYEEYLSVGSLSWLPRRVPLMNEDLVIGFIPILIEDPLTAMPMT